MADFKMYVEDIQNNLFDIEHAVEAVDIECVDNEDFIPDKCGYEWMHMMHHFGKMKEFIDDLLFDLDEEDDGED